MDIGLDINNSFRPSEDIRALSLLAPDRELGSQSAVAGVLDDIHATDSRVLSRVAGQHRATIRSINVEAQVSLASPVGPHDLDCYRC